MINEIIGKRIVLRKAKENDLEQIYNSIWSDQNIYKYLFIEPVFNKIDAEDKLKRTVEFQKNNYAYFVTLKETDEVIGFCGINEDSLGVYSETGICIATKYQGQGYAKELLNLLCELVFYKLKGNKLIYAHMIHNQKSKNLCLSFNFKHFESKEEIRDYDNYKVICEYYYLDKETYQKNKD